MLANVQLAQTTALFSTNICGISILYALYIMASRGMV